MPRSKGNDGGATGPGRAPPLAHRRPHRRLVEIQIRVLADGGEGCALASSVKQLGFTPFSTELPRNDLNHGTSASTDRTLRRTFGTDDDRIIRAELAKARKPAAKACADGSPPPCKKKPPVRKPPKRDDKVLDLKVDDLKGF